MQNETKFTAQKRKIHEIAQLLSLSLSRSLGCAILAITFSIIPLHADDNINERIKALEVELQNAMKSTYLPNDEQIARIKKELDLLKMQQELEAIKQKQSGATQSTKPQSPQNYESQNLQIQDSQKAQDSRTTNQSTQRQDSQPKEYKFSTYDGSPTNRKGIFFGVEVGYIEAKGDVSFGNIINVVEKKGGVNYGIMGGYAYFFNNYFGARIYGNLNASHIKFSNEGIEHIDTLLTTLNWGVNVDLVVNFVALRSYFDFGAYLGIFIGANSFLETGFFDTLMRMYENSGFKVNKTCFDVALNAGLRMMATKNIGIEIGVKVPFLKSYIINEDAYSRADLSHIGKAKIAFKPNYSANFRLLYKF